MWLRNYNLFCFGRLTEFEVILEEQFELSAKRRISGKWFLTVDNAKTV